MRNAALLFVVLFSAVAMGQTTHSVNTNDQDIAAIDAMRKDIVDAFNKGDVDRMLSHLDPDCVVTWQNGEVCHGPDEVKTYYNKMMTGPDKVVESVTADPQVTQRHVYAEPQIVRIDGGEDYPPVNDWAISTGEMHDHFKLKDGRDLDLNSKFTATLSQRGEAETHPQWKIMSLHLSVNAFDNPVIHVAVTKVALWTGAIAGMVGLIIGLIMGRVGRRKSA